MGQKEGCSASHKDASAKLASFYNEFSDVLKEERVYRRGKITIAEWSEEKRMVVVTKIKGSCWNQYGHNMACGTSVFYPEEALFLIEQNQLEFYYKEVVLSLQEAYALLLPLLPSLEYYKVYGYLNRSGCKVQRWLQTSERDRIEAHATSMPPTGANPIEPCDTSVDKELEPLQNGPGAVLWTDPSGCRPLVRPDDATSYESLVNTMRVIPSPIDVNDVTTQRVSLAFSVFDCTVKQYRKTLPGTPSFNVAVCRFNDRPPDAMETLTLQRSSCGIPLKFAVVGRDAVTMLSIFDPHLPALNFP